MHLEGNGVWSWKRTAVICFISASLVREGGLGACFGALGVCGLDTIVGFPSPLRNGQRFIGTGVMTLNISCLERSGVV
jgi:hypothetical protein